MSKAEIDLERIKNILASSSSPTLTCNSMLPSAEYLEKIKNERYSSVFESLWPNLYKNKDLKEKEQAEQEQKRKDQALLDHLLKRTGQTLAPAPSNYESLEKTAASLGMNGLNININCGSRKEPEPVPAPAPAVSVPLSCVSSYDFAANNRAYSLYNSELCKAAQTAEMSREALLVKDIIDSQSVLRERAAKYTETSEVVDDILSKAAALQNEIKKKADALKFREELAEFDRNETELLRLQRRNSQISQAASTAAALSTSSDRSGLHYIHHVDRLDHSLHECSSSRSKPPLREVVRHDCYQTPRERPSRPQIRSILKTSSRSRTGHNNDDSHSSRERSASRGRSSSRGREREERSASRNSQRARSSSRKRNAVVSMSTPNYLQVESKVNCWGSTSSNRHDHNIY